MTDSAWWTAWKAMAIFVRSWVPQRLVLWRWPTNRVVAGIDVFPTGGAPRFYVGSARSIATLEQLAFNVHNLTPIDLKLVGLDLTVSINSTPFLRYEHRLPSENAAKAFTRGGFYIRHELSDAQCRVINSHSGDWVRIAIYGWVFLKSAIGEYRKEVQADIVALIDGKGGSRAP